MYYIEECVDGEWYYKHTPKGKWKLFTREMLLQKILHEQACKERYFNDLTKDNIS